MNIFVLDLDPKICAQSHCDRHVVKMILESVQLLSTANRIMGLDEGYKITHANHPCSVWTRETLGNWLWLRTLAYELENERQFRWGPKPRHKAIEVLDTLSKPKNMIDGEIESKIYNTEFAQAMPIQFKDKDVVRAYRRYYQNKTFPTWTKRKPPSWWFI